MLPNRRKSWKEIISNVSKQNLDRFLMVIAHGLHFKIPALERNYKGNFLLYFAANNIII
jgi:hypothetical protein